MKYLNDYLEGSTVHGLRYLSGRECFCTRISWAAVLIIQFSLVILFMCTFVRDWATNQVSTQTSVKNIREIPFPDMVVNAETKTYWAATEEFLAKADKNDEVLGLFDTIPILASMLSNSLCIGAQFKAENDHDNLSTKEILEGFKNLFGNTADCPDCGKKTNMPLTGDIFTNDKIKEHKSLKKTLLEACKEEVFNESDKITMSRLIYGQVIKTLSHRDFIYFLNNILRKGAGFIKKLFTEEETNNIFGFITKISGNLDDFNGLPIPVGLRLTVNSDVSEIAESLTNEDKFDPTAYTNYKVSKWPGFYDLLLSCLNATTCQNEKKLSSILDPLVLNRTDEFLKLFRATILNDSSFKSCIHSLDIYDDMSDKCSGPRFDPFFETNTFSSLLENLEKPSEADVLTKKVTMFLVDMGSNLDLGDNVFGVRAQESNSFPDRVKARGYPVSLKLGMIHTLEISPVQYEETENFGKLDEQTRKCQTSYSRERRDQQPYRITNCAVEKALKGTMDMFHCQSPLFKFSGGPPECPKLTMMYFESFFMENQLGKALQSCLAPCRSITYKMRIVSSEPLQETIENMMLRYKDEYPMGLGELFENKTGRDLLDLVQFESSVESVKKRRFEKLALVKIRFGEADFQVITRDQKLTSFDKFSLLGGTMGLLTGFSVVSVVEVVYWVVRWAWEVKVKKLENRVKGWK